MKAFAFAALLMTCFIASSFSATVAQDAIGQAYDWTLNVETQQLQSQFGYKGSPFSKPNKLTVTCYPEDDQTAAWSYQKMWYHDGRPLGLERLGKFVDEGDNVCIRVVGKGGLPTDPELKAAANAVMRLWLDAKANRNSLTIVKVPTASFATMQGFLHAQHCLEVPMDDPEKVQTNYMRFSLVSEPPGQKTTLSYQP